MKLADTVKAVLKGKGSNAVNMRTMKPSPQAGKRLSNYS
jgi:hypothetical protein